MYKCLKLTALEDVLGQAQKGIQEFGILLARCFTQSVSGLHVGFEFSFVFMEGSGQGNIEAGILKHVVECVAHSLKWKVK